MSAFGCRLHNGYCKREGVKIHEAHQEATWPYADFYRATEANSPEAPSQDPIGPVAEAVAVVGVMVSIGVSLFL